MYVNIIFYYVIQYIIPRTSPKKNLFWKISTPPHTHKKRKTTRSWSFGFYVCIVSSSDGTPTTSECGVHKKCRDDPRFCMQLPYERRNTYIYIHRWTQFTCQRSEKMPKVPKWTCMSWRLAQDTHDSAWQCCLSFSVVCFPRFRAGLPPSVPWSKVATSAMIVQPCPNIPIKHSSQQLFLPWSKLAKHQRFSSHL